MDFVRLHWKLILIGIAAIVILVWIGSVTGTNRKLFNMALNQIRTDQSKVVKVLEDQVTSYEQEIANLEAQLQATKKQQMAVRQENERLKGRVLEIQTKRETVVVSGDPDRIVIELRRLGFSSAKRIKR
jgi:TolA-binding protein